MDSASRKIACSFVIEGCVIEARKLSEPVPKRCLPFKLILTFWPWKLFVIRCRENCFYPVCVTFSFGGKSNHGHFLLMGKGVLGSVLLVHNAEHEVDCLDFHWFLFCENMPRGTWLDLSTNFQLLLHVFSNASIIACTSDEPRISLSWFVLQTIII